MCVFFVVKIDMFNRNAQFPLDLIEEYKFWLSQTKRQCRST